MEFKDFKKQLTGAELTINLNRPHAFTDLMTLIEYVDEKSVEVIYGKDEDGNWRKQ